jgi:hypothetical protein
MPVPTRVRRATAIVVLLAVLALSMLAAIGFGAVSVGPGDIGRAIGRAITGEARARGTRSSSTSVCRA